MGRIVTTVLLVALGVVVTASYGSELAKKIQDDIQAHPEKMCEILAPVSDAVAKLNVPFGAQHPKEVIWRPTDPDGFHAVLGLMQVASVTPCSFTQDATIAIRAFRLIERNPATGQEKVVSEVTDFTKRTKKNERVFDHRLYRRLPSWYANNAEYFDSAPVTTYNGPELTVDVAKSPERLFHGWTNPKVSANPGMNYLVEMEVKITGSARLQMGIDYWLNIDSQDNGFDWDCKTSNNCQGYLSKWYGVTDGFQTIRVPSGLMK